MVDPGVRLSWASRARKMSSISIPGRIGFRPSFEGEARSISRAAAMNTVVCSPKIVASANVKGVSLEQSSAYNGTR